MARAQSTFSSSSMTSCTDKSAPGMFGGPSFLPSHNDLCKRHMDATGKPCIKIDPSSKPQTINPHIFEHWVAVTNGCGQAIKVRICYYKTQQCIVADTPPWGRRDVVLGIFPSLRDFRYDYTEQF
jgi:hypothetical protein